jgi:hypothetical protein
MFPIDGVGKILCKEILPTSRIRVAVGDELRQSSNKQKECGDSECPTMQANGHDHGEAVGKVQ